MQLEEAALHGSLLINDVIYAETSVRFHSIDDFDAALATAGVTVAPIPRTALFLAGKAFHAVSKHRRRSHRCAAGFFHRRPRDGREPAAADA
jgi:hypothetical protein